MVVFPLTFASSISVEPGTMPGWPETAVGYDPITHLATAVRGLMSGTTPVGEIGWSLAVCAALIAVFVPITMYRYGNRE